MARYTRTEYITWTDNDGDHMVKVFGSYTSGDPYVHLRVGNDFKNDEAAVCVRNFNDGSSYVNNKSDFDDVFVDFYHWEAQDWVNSNFR